MRAHEEKDLFKKKKHTNNDLKSCMLNFISLESILNVKRVAIIKMQQNIKL